MASRCESAAFVLPLLPSIRVSDRFVTVRETLGLFSEEMREYLCLTKQGKSVQTIVNEMSSVYEDYVSGALSSKEIANQLKKTMK